MIYMKDNIKNIIGLLIRVSGVFYVLREIILRNKVTILFYHNPSTEVLQNHIEFLSKYYTFITLERLVDAIRKKKAGMLPPKSLVLTIDDGFKENYCLLKLFKQHKIRPTIYLCSHVINTKRKLWFTLGFGEGYRLREMRACNIKTEFAKYDYRREKEYADRQMLNFAEIREMSSFVDFQSHSKFHPLLPNCDDKECRREIGHSKLALEALMEKRIDHFSYPNGEYKDREILYAKECGYQSCRSMDLGWNDIHTDPNRLKAMGIEDDATVNTLVGRITGLYGFFRFLRLGKINKLFPDMRRQGKHTAYAR
jgi:peptidoglycan/xylan/chitin deacetylase (PgdA/CDA1 family)